MAEVRRLHEHQACLHKQAQRVPGLEEQLQAISLATAQASQVGTHNVSWLSCCHQPFEPQLFRA